MNLSRFLDAQAPFYADALAELRAGRKHTHWIWFVLPQLRGLGHSDNATYYGLENATEATAYLAHPVLGTRLRERRRIPVFMKTPTLLSSIIALGVASLGLTHVATAAEVSPGATPSDTHPRASASGHKKHARSHRSRLLKTKSVKHKGHRAHSAPAHTLSR